MVVPDERCTDWCRCVPDDYLEVLWSLITDSPTSITTCLQKSK